MTRSRSTFALIAAAAAMLVMAAPAAGQGKDFYGVGAGGPVGAQDFPLMRQANVGSLRFLVNWPELSNFNSLDAMIGGAAARGVRSMPFIYQRPPPTTKPQRRALASFAATMVRRYGRGGTFWAGKPPAATRPITSWQILNEQNGPAYWGARPNPRLYAKALRATTRAIRKVNRRAEIVLGGMFATPRGRGKLTSAQYLNRLYRVKGITRFFNTVAIHPYAAGLKGVRKEIARTRRIMRRNGHRKGRLRVTEYGWGSARGGHRLLKGPKGQARLLRKSLRMMGKKRKRWRLKGVHWYSWVDGTAPCPFCSSSGLVTTDRQRKPSFKAFRAVAR